MPSGYSVFTSCSFDPRKNKLDCHKGEDCMKRFCKELREHAMKIMNYKKKMIPLTYEKNELCEMQKVCYIAKKYLVLIKTIKNVFKLYHKVRDHCHYIRKFRGAAHSICNSRYKTPKEILVVFHNSSIYDYYFIINKLAKECDGQLECYNNKTITYKLKFVDSFRFI